MKNTVTCATYHNWYTDTDNKDVPKTTYFLVLAKHLHTIILRTNQSIICDHY
jgi:hypothetical protein